MKARTAGSIHRVVVKTRWTTPSGARGCRARPASGARFLRGVADDDEAAGQDLDVVRVAPGLFRPRSDVGIVALGIGELAAGIRGAGLDDDRPALDRPRDVQRAAHRQELALVVEHVHPLGVKIDAALDIADEGVLGPAVPQPGHDIEELAGPAVAFAVLHMLGQPEI
jgi:hypothetical protein